MKTKLILPLLLLASVSGVWFAKNSHAEAAPTEKAMASKTLYTCGMHPSVIQDHPGNCSICGMKLTPIKGDSAKADMENSPVIAVDAVTRQNMNLRTAEVLRGPLRKNIRTVGTIDYNETAIADVTTRFKGWIEKVNVDATGQIVHRGDSLIEVSSPEFYQPQVDFLEAVTNKFKNFRSVRNLYTNAVRNLKLIGFQDSQIAQIESTRQVLKTFSVPAPIAGFVVEKNAALGQMVDGGIRLYRIADLGIVWVLAQIYEQDLPFIQLGQEAVVKVASMPDREFRGRVTFIYPTVDEKTRTAKVRLEFENPGYFLKPGMFVSAQIQAALEASAVLVPDSAVLRSGTRNTAFIARDGGKFEARDVTLGIESQDGLIQIVSGLNAGERVVTSGQFLLDSESQLREAIEKMRGSSTSPKSQMTSDHSDLTPTPVASAKTENDATLYVCPMPEHVSIVYEHAGNCPICGMALVPVSSSALKKIQPGGKVLYYTCPMPEHASVHEDKPGKCPLCAMTLIPVMSTQASTVAAPKTNSWLPAKTGTKQLYTCPMHPEVISDKPGICPKCEMNLVPQNNSAK